MKKTVLGSCVLPRHFLVVPSQRVDLSVAQSAQRGCTSLHSVVRCRNPTEMQMQKLMTPVSTHLTRYSLSLRTIILCR